MSAAAVSGLVPRLLEHYRGLTLAALLEGLPDRSPSYLYELIPVYPSRPGKGLRAALCLATCRALGGRLERALNSAVAVELFHNAFLIHDDVQDESESRRGGPTLHAEHGVGIAVNVGNAMSLLALGRLRANREILGPTLAWRIFAESEEMMRHSLEGQALELAWIRDNACDLTDDDYYRMCLKKTSWYTAIYPCRVGALIATEGRFTPERLDRFGWYLGAAFQIQDDLLNLVGDYGKYGKEIAGDLLEGKRTLMLIHLLRSAGAAERAEVGRFLAKRRHERTGEEVHWLLGLLDHHGSLDFARRAALDLARAALAEGEVALKDVADSEDKAFLLETVRYVIERDR
jgi:geranylgeranyl diphosphate synthase, type II